MEDTNDKIQQNEKEFEVENDKKEEENNTAENAEENEDANVSKYSSYVHPDGRKWAELSEKEKKKIRQKMKKKEKQAQLKKYKEELAKQNEGKSAYEIELNWCIHQLKLGLTNPGVTHDQCKILLN